VLEAFSGMREGGEHPESASTIGGALGQRYAAAARSGSMPHDPGSSWPRSVMHGPDKHRSLFEAFANLKPPSAGGTCRGAHLQCTHAPPDVPVDEKFSHCRW